MDIKIRLDDETIAALDNMRIHDSPVPGRIVIKSRNEMVRSLILEGLAGRQAAIPVAEKIAAAKQRTTESRERTAALRAKK